MEKLLKVFVQAAVIPLILAGFGFARVNDPSGRWTATLQRGDATGVAVFNLKIESNSKSYEGELYKCQILS